MIKGGKGGSHTQSGLQFEVRVSLADLFANIPGYSVEGGSVKRNGVVVGQLCGKNKLYKNILEPRGVDVRKIISKKLVPDEAILIGKTVYVIEMKFQVRAGSVDEKLQTCDFKRKQYLRLFQPLGIGVEYVYVLNDWFEDPAYKDVLEYIRSVGCHYFFGEIPLSFFGLAR